MADLNVNVNVKVKAPDTADVKYRMILCSKCLVLLTQTGNCGCQNSTYLTISTGGITYGGKDPNYIFRIGADFMPVPIYHVRIPKVERITIFKNITNESIRLFNYQNQHYATIEQYNKDFQTTLVHNLVWDPQYIVGDSNIPIPIVVLKEDVKSDIELESLPPGLDKEDKIIAYEDVAHILKKKGFKNIYIVDTSIGSVVRNLETNVIIGYKKLIKIT